MLSFFINYAGIKNVIQNTLYENIVKGKRVCKTKTVFYRTYEPVVRVRILHVPGFPLTKCASAAI